MKTLIKNAAIFNGVDNKIYTDKNILIEDNKILTISECAESITADCEIDVKGKTVMPGLIDAHMHIMLYQQSTQSLEFEAIRSTILLKQTLSRGFTTIRDVGGEIWGIIKAVNDGMVEAPRIFYSGKALSQTGGHGDMRPAKDISPQYASQTYSNCHQSIIVDGVEAIRKAARENFLKGASFVKIMASGGCVSPHDTIFSNQFSIEEIRAAVEIGHTYNTYTAAHAYMPYSIKRCVENGVRTIEHGNFLDKETAKLMAKNNAFIIPTLITYNLAYEDVVNGKNFTFFISGETLKLLCDNGLEAIINAREAGVKIGFGTDIVKPDGIYDTTSAFSRQNDEFLLRSKIESPFDTLNSATAVNAEIINMKDKLGVIKPEAFADLLVIDGNPLTDIKLLTEHGKYIKVIMKDGKVVKNVLPTA